MLHRPCDGSSPTYNHLCTPTVHCNIAAFLSSAHESCTHSVSAFCRKARSDARRAQAEADALKQEAAELRERADQLLQNLRAAEDDVSAPVADLHSVC